MSPHRIAKCVIKSTLEETSDYEGISPEAWDSELENKHVTSAAKEDFALAGDLEQVLSKIEADRINGKLHLLSTEEAQQRFANQKNQVKTIKRLLAQASSPK